MLYLLFIQTDGNLSFCTYTVEYKQPNLAPAPYGLSGTLENKNLTLTWQSPEAANEMNYQDKTSGSKASWFNQK